MTHDDLRANLRTVAAGILTPFGENMEVAHGKLRENVQAVHDRGIRTFLACANISEYHSLSHEERVAVTETSVDALPSAACVLAGAGGSTKTALELAYEFERVGVDALMVMPPMHAYKHERGLLDYYRKLAEGTDLPLVPYVRGFDPSVDFLADLTELPGVVGVKYAIEDVPKFAEAVVAGDNDVVWVDGMAEPYAPALYVEGAEGFTAGVSNFEPRIGLALLEALEDGDFERAKSIRDVTLPYQNLRSERGADNVFPGANSIPAVKYGLELAGLHGGPVREPLVGLSEADEKRAAERYERIEAFVENEL